jgi:GR25 family glycosyltransferase involved in LPS biosynthesis/glycosyltransferase involved in cell wall biosynthesis
MKTIGLSMIVKDEAHVILKCLESVRPLVDHVLVVDTGSTDGTQQIVWNYLLREQLSGGVVEEPWQNFAYNRTFALQELRKAPDVDYALIIDADDQLELDDGFDPAAFKASLDQDLYDVEVLHGNMRHVRPQLFRNDLPFSFKGVVHEYLEAPPGDLSRGRTTGFRVKISGGGARSRNTRKFEDDAALLERALSTESDPFLISRYTFYLAQSYRDCGDKERALENYLKRAELGYWAEEIYISLLEAGNMMAALSRPFDEVIATYLRAADTVPTRAEALHAASRYCRDHGRNAEGYEYARRGIDLAQPASALFAQPWVYDYGLLDEYAVNAYWAGAFRECLDASLRLLASDKLPQSMHARVVANARFAADKLPKPANLGSLGAEGFIEQHALVPQRPLRARVTGAPRVLLGILAKQKEPALPLYLDCIEALDYPKSSIVLYIRTNNNTDRTEQILCDWVARVGHFYAAVEFDSADAASRVEEFREHEWNATRFRVLGQIRNASLRRARELECDFYFVADVDNFVRRATLRELVALNLPIVAPLLRPIIPEKLYSNYHAEIDPAGYFKGCDQYYWILSRQVRGVVEVPVIHCTYLIRADVIPELTYQDGTDRHEYVVFSDSARKARIPQYLDNRQLYGYLTFAEGELYVSDGIERACALLRDDLSAYNRETEVPAASRGAIPQIHLINLDRSVERLAQFQKRNGHLRRLVRFPAVDGRSLDRSRLIDEGIIARDLQYSEGALGCAMSHIALWKVAVQEGRAITIAEDDGLFARHFETRSTALLAGVPADWDIVMWGFNFAQKVWVEALPGVTRMQSDFYQGPLRQNIENFQDLDTNPALLRLGHLFGTVCYSVSPKGARALLDFCLPLSTKLIDFPGFGVRIDNEGIDCAMNIAYPSLRAFVCVPPLVVTENRSEISTIRGEEA